MNEERSAAGPCKGMAATRSGHNDRRPPRDREGTGRLDFAEVNRAAMGALPAILERWLPDGHRRGHEYVARNPTRTDRRPGSFSVNMRTGRWSDFATGDRGGDPVSLAAYLHNLTQAEAARRLAEMLGVRL